MKKTNKKGFTLVEIMIVVAIIGLLAAIGIPSFQKARANSIQKSMDNNARIVASAVEQWAMETGNSATNTAIDAAIVGAYIKNYPESLTVGAVAPTTVVPGTLGASDGWDGATMYSGNYPTP